MPKRFFPILAMTLAVAAQGQVPGQTEPAAPQPDGPPRPALLLADTAHTPTVRVSWPRRDGRQSTLSGQRPYRSPGDKATLGGNIDAYVALGGTRLDRSKGHPDGAIIRFGLYKKDATRPFFEDLAEEATITLTIAGIRMNKAAVPHPETGLMHLKYMLSDLKACGIDPTGRNLFVTADPDDPLKPTVTEGSGKFGFLDGGPGHGSATGKVEEDGSITITFSFPYHALRHTRDPSQRTAPGTFFEPQHFHVEMEVRPAPIGIPAEGEPATPD